MVSIRVSLNLKRSLNIFPQETVTVGENRFAPKLSEKEVIELLENATPESVKKATKYDMKIFKGKNLPKLYFENVSIGFSQSKTMQYVLKFTHLKIICAL